MNLTLGKQVEGSSPSSTKTMALRAISSLPINKFGVIADIGGGRGELATQLVDIATTIYILDDFESNLGIPKISYVKSDLNSIWDLKDVSIDFLFSLEVIEHLENPRHFFREINRVLKPGGYGFVSTPNNNNIFSKIYFFFRGCHRFFQDSCYPAHLTPLMQKDFERLTSENDFEHLGFYYNYSDTVPLINKSISVNIPGFSSSVGVLFRKPL